MMKNDNLKILKILVISVTGLTILAGVGYLLFSWNNPINPALELPTEPPDINLILVTQDAQSNGDGVEPTPIPSPTIEPVCGAPPSLNILVSGVASNDYLYGLADAVRIVRIDFQVQEIQVLALPRDLWVKIPGLEKRGIDAGKLNQAFFYGTEGMGYYSGSGFGSGLLAETILHNYGFRVDKYLAINLRSFRIIIDTLGGIDVYLDHDVYKRVYDQPELFLKAGHHHLDGKQTEMLARQRISIGDFGRINNQTVILKAVAQKLLSPSGIAAIPAMVDQLKSNVQTDLSPADISQLICLAGMIDFGVDINFTTLPAEMMIEQMVYDPVRGIKTAALVGDEDKIRTILAEFNQGIWP